MNTRVLNTRVISRRSNGAFPRAALLPTLIATLLTGCALGPDYRRPAAPLPERFSEAPEASAERTAPVEKAWWTLFGDATLDALMQQAFTANTDLAAAVARVEEAEALSREAGALRWPQVNVEAGVGRTQASTATAIPLPATAPRLRDSRRVALSTSFELDVWGRLRRANEAARAQALATGYARDTVQLSLASLVAGSYLSLRAHDAELAVTQGSVGSRETALRIARSRLEGGVASPLDVYQAESALAAARAQLATLRQQRALAQNQLGLLTGQPGLTLAAGDLRALPMPPVPPAGLPSSLLAARPDLRQAEETLVSANARIGVARAALFPTLSLTGSLGSESAALSNLFSSGAGAWSLGLGLIGPLFDMGRNQARVDQASAQQRQAVAQYQKAVQTAFREVMDALVGLRESAEAEAEQARRVEAANKVLKLAQLRYESGYSAFLEVLDAQRGANDTQMNHLAARQTRLTAAVDLFKALGGGWRDEDSRMTEVSQR